MTIGGAGLALPAVHLLRLVARDPRSSCSEQRSGVLSGDHWMSATPPLKSLTFCASPPARLSSQICPPLFLLVLGAARGDEREVLVVGAPARRRLAVGRRGELQLLAAVPLHHPDVGVASILLGVDGGDRVGHPRAVGRALRIADGEDARVIVEGEGPFGLRLRHRRDEQCGSKDQRRESRRHVAQYRRIGRRGTPATLTRKQLCHTQAVWPRRRSRSSGSAWR